MSPQHCRLTKMFLLLGMASVHFTMLAQTPNRLSGRVINVETKEPIPFANVFFANTTIGASAKEDGTFVIEKFPIGKYDLTITSIGYRSFQSPIDFTIPHKQVVEVLLHEDAVALETVEIREKDPDREHNYRMFKKLFIGATSASQKCEVVNPDDIYLYYDQEANDLTAHARKPIEMINQALGLKIIYHLKTFNYNYKSGEFMVTGMPQIQYLQPSSKGEERRWIKHRKETYNGSVMHFMRMMLKDSIIQEGFAVSRVYSVRNKDRLPQAVLDQKIKRLRETMSPGDRIILNANDSLAYYLRMNRKPEFKDSIATEKLSARALLKGTESVDYQGKLQVIYEKEKEEWAYVQSIGKRTIDDQASLLHFRGQSIHIYPNGYFEDQLNIFLEGYWSWSEKISCLLPLDYDPRQDVPKLK